MNIGVIVYSQTGNTLGVAEKIRDKLVEGGHPVALEEIKITGKTPARPGSFELSRIPSTDGYDALILGAPVQAFSLNPAMKAYLAQLPNLDGKKVALFVTKGLPTPWLGGSGSIKIMKRECESRGAAIVGSAIIPWATSKRAETIKKCVETMAANFAG